MGADSIPKKEQRAYAELAKMTHEYCDAACRDLRPYRCCESYYCELAIRYAARRGVELKTTGHPTLPLMGADNRCTAPPHLRPICTAHHCKIAAFGFGPNEAWTDRYFRLREKAGAEADMDQAYECDNR